MECCEFNLVFMPSGHPDWILYQCTVCGSRYFEMMPHYIKPPPSCSVGTQ
jgi:hypothetical protein